MSNAKLWRKEKTIVTLFEMSNNIFFIWLPQRKLYNQKKNCVGIPMSMYNKILFHISNLYALCFVSHFEPCICVQFVVWCIAFKYCLYLFCWNQYNIYNTKCNHVAVRQVKWKRNLRATITRSAAGVSSPPISSTCECEAGD